jgi:SAM-dependent methyltransferase
MLNSLDINRQQVDSEKDPFTSRRYNQMSRALGTRGGKVLDVGCNVGRGGIILRNNDPESTIVGLDLVPERLARLPLDTYSGGACGVLQHLPFPDGAFSAVVAAEVIEHIPSHLIDAALAEVFRVLAKGGTFVLTTPNPDGLPLRLRGASVLDEPSHVSVHHPRSLKSRLLVHGFSKVRLKGSGVVSKAIGPHVPILSLYGGFLASAVKV